MKYTWVKELEIGDKLVDGQHKELVTMYNNMLDIFDSPNRTNDEKKAEIGKALNFLCTYAIQHFTDEEALQKKLNYPNFEKHREIHEDFKSKAFNLVEKFEAENDLNKFALIFKMKIGMWLVTHIKEEDSRISEYLGMEAVA